MRKSFIALVIGATGMTGCASVTDYNLYAQTQQIIAQEKAKADIARYNALKEIAQRGDSAAQVAAVITLNQTTPTTGSQQGLAPPTNLHDTLLKWVSIILPSAVQVYGIGKNAEVAVTNSNNSRDISINSTRSMVDMGKLISGKEVPVIGSSEDVLLYPESNVPE